MRDAFPVERIVQMAESLAVEATSEQVRLAALQLISERAHGKVTDKLEIAAGTADDDDLDVSHLSLEQLRELALLEEQRDKLLAPPMVIDVGNG